MKGVLDAVSAVVPHLHVSDNLLTFCSIHSQFRDCSTGANSGKHWVDSAGLVGSSVLSKLVNRVDLSSRRKSGHVNDSGNTLKMCQRRARRYAEAKPLLYAVAIILALSMAHVCNGAACFRSSASGCPPRPSNANFAASGPLELTLSWDSVDASFAVTSYSVIYLNDWYEQVVFDAGLNTAFTFLPTGVTSVDGQSVQTTKGAFFQVTVLASNSNGNGYYITPFLTATAIALPSPPTSAVLCESKSLSEQYLCAATSSEQLRWDTPADLGAGEGEHVAILAFHVQSGNSEEELNGAVVVTVDPSTALRPDGLYQSDSVAGSLARVWVETAAGTSTAATATLSGSCTGELLVSVLFSAGGAFESSGATGDSDVVLSMELTTASLLPSSSVLLLIFPDGFYFSADPEPILTHRNTGVLRSSLLLLQQL